MTEKYMVKVALIEVRPTNFMQFGARYHETEEVMKQIISKTDDYSTAYLAFNNAIYGESDRRESNTVKGCIALLERLARKLARLMRSEGNRNTRGDSG
jgi:hypothetical protein